MMTAETPANVRLTPKRRQMLSKLAQTLFDEGRGEVLVKCVGGYETDRSKEVFSARVVGDAFRDGLLADVPSWCVPGRKAAYGISRKGLLLYQNYLADHSGIGAHD